MLCPVVFLGDFPAIEKNVVESIKFKREMLDTSRRT
jgi:hypothetical protein